jgi:hypothetical protein
MLPLKISATNYSIRKLIRVIPERVFRFRKSRSAKIQKEEVLQMLEVKGFVELN